MGNVQFRLQSNLNISFDHVVDSDIPEDEWAEMTEAQKQDAMTETLWEHVDVSEENA